MSQNIIQAVGNTQYFITYNNIILQIYKHPGATFQSSQNGAKTHIDAIFTSPDFPFVPLYCHTRKSFLYLSDHLIVAAYFQPVETQKEKLDRRLSIKRKVYNVNKMDDSDWQAFANYSDKYYKDHNYKQHKALPTNRRNTNLLWTKIKEILITTANKTVPISYRSADDPILKPKTLTSCYTALKQLNKMLLQFRIKYINRSIRPDETT